MDPKAYYRGLWSTKNKVDRRQLPPRDWLHRLILDPIFDPSANPRTAVALARLQGGRRLLDIGCWNGNFLEQVNATGRYQELYGVDLIPEAIETVRKKGFQAQAVDLNGELLPFPDGYFDGITMLGVLEHVFDPYTVLRDIRRVLHRNGQFIIDVPNVGSLTNRLRILLGRIPVTSRDPGWDGGHLHYFTKHDLDRLLIDEGFDIVARTTTGGRPRIRERWLSLMAGELLYVCRCR
jgi:methionine biosynthesis protein MetW